MTVRVTVMAGSGLDENGLSEDCSARDAVVTIHEGDATVADLARALGRQVGIIDGRAHQPCDALAGTTLRAGSIIGGTVRAAAAPPAADLVAVAGPQAGRRWPLRPGPNVVGRSSGADVVIDDPELAARQLRILVSLSGSSAADLSASRSTRVGDVLVRAGRAAYRVEPPADTISPGSTGAFHRPPRPAPPARPEPVVVPTLDPEPAPRLPMTLATVAGPLVVALVAATVMGSWWIVTMALGGAVVALGLSVEHRLRDRRAHRSAGRRRAEDLRRLEADLAQQAAATGAARWVLACGPAEAVRRALTGSSRLWERRPADVDAYLALVGVADVEHRAEVVGGTAESDEAAALLTRPLTDVPVVVRLGPGDVIGLGGDVEGLARSLLLQLAVTHGPADLRPRVRSRWEWARWLPHSAGTGMPLLVVEAGAADVAGAVREVVAEGGAALVLAPSVERLPAACAEVVEVEAGRAVVRRTCDGRRIDGVLVAAVEEEVAEQAARALAAWTDPEDAGGGLPDAVALSDLVPLGSVAARWAHRRPPTALVGMGGSGPFRIDLAADGPHALVAGTTGSGKSELLRTLIAGLALEVPPDRLNMVLIDYKGGSAFDRCADLPHVVGYVTDLDEHLGARALVCLRAELRRREQALRVSAAATIDELAPGVELPRLLVVVDEFAALRADLPDLVGGLVDLAQRGRSLGVHLVLATQRPAGSVSEDIRANTDLRIALRVQSGTDSMDVIGSPDAALIGRRHPGRALLRTGGGDAVMLQTATTGRPRPAPARSRVEARWCDEPTPAPAGPTDLDLVVDAVRDAWAPAGPTDLDLVVDAVRDAWAPAGRTLPPGPWLEPLPERIDLAEILDSGDGGQPDARIDRVIVGVVDRPAEQRQDPLCWRPGEGNLLLVGAAGSGTTTALLAVAASACWGRAAGALQIFGLERRAGSLRPLVDAPSSTVVGPAGPDRTEVLQHLTACLDARTSMGEAGPAILVLVDGWPVIPDDPDGWTVREALVRLWVDGPAAGIHTAVASERSAAVPSAVAAGTTQRWYLRPCDPSELVLAGLASLGAVPTFVPGRLLVADGGWEAQIGEPGAVLHRIMRPRIGGLKPIGI